MRFICIQFMPPLAKKILLTLGMFVLLMAAGIYLLRHRTSTDFSEKNIRVTTSFYPLYFFVQSLGKDRVTVTNITPPGAEPHEYEPTAQDILTMNTSALLVLNGGGLEPWGASIQKNMQSAQTFVVVASKDLSLKTLREDGKTFSDPHVWLSPPLAKQMVNAIASGLEAVDPVNASFYAQNADVLQAKLSALDAEFRSGLSECKQKEIVTSHTAFAYLASTYGLKQISIAGVSPDSEPSPAQLANIASFVKKNNVSTIFFEQLVSPKLSETLAREVGARTAVLDPLEGMTAIDEAQRKDYFTQMRSNLETLKKALVCQQ